MRSTALDGMRGYAALAVIIYHCVLHFVGPGTNALIATSIFEVNGWYYKLTKAIITVFDGQTAVFVFFVISGAVLFKSLERQSDGILPRALRFVTARVLRIYPPLIVCLVGYWAMATGINAVWPNVFAVPPFSAVARNAALFDSGVLGATWTLKAEMAAMPVIFGAFLLFRAGGVATLAGIGCLAILTFDPSGLTGPLYMATLWSLYFIGGFIAAETANSHLVFELTRGIRWVVPLVVALTIRGLFPLGSFGVTLVQCFCICVLVAHALSDASSAFKRFANRPTSLLLGKISYSLYLWNVPVLLLLIPFGASAWSSQHPLEAGLMLFVPVAAIAIPVAWLSATYLEGFRLPSGRARAKKPARDLESDRISG